MFADIAGIFGDCVIVSHPDEIVDPAKGVACLFIDVAAFVAEVEVAKEVDCGYAVVVGQVGDDAWLVDGTEHAGFPVERVHVERGFGEVEEEPAVGTVLHAGLEVVHLPFVLHEEGDIEQWHRGGIGPAGTEVAIATQPVPVVGQDPAVGR